MVPTYKEISCPFCGRVVRDSDKYCIFCGSKIQKAKKKKEKTKEQEIIEQEVDKDLGFLKGVSKNKDDKEKTDTPFMIEEDSQEDLEDTVLSLEEIKKEKKSKKDSKKKKNIKIELPQEIKDQLECKMKLAIIEDKKKKLKEKLKALKEDLNEEKYEYDMDYAKQINVKLNAFKVIKEEFNEKEENLRTELGPKGMFRVDELEDELEVQREQLIELKRAFKLHKVKKDIYEQLRLEYSTGFREAEKELHDLRSNIIRWLSSEKADKNRLENRIRLLQGRYKTKEVDEEEFKRQKKEISLELERVAQRVKILEIYSRAKKKKFF
ncbi:hypothetical protein DSAG12_00727 [Promethearchaeum syntrophicum]|uniref:Zinc-ribbon domain-containing protein n=1 Tax=Promethearchaeum syntrophicum TaxID=2594042 RepID=A0A5B9D8G7_9ARCH|nr:hypothetical protein [Candidatus Prometheoarchaeum syntrophicum]QEE14906.1 hypothetical protein DSAG12_00727 [Candidatus Prometheoarchaeum syntrophicum]